MEKVSVITVNLNNADALKSCIRSVGAQDYEAYEHIVIDGQSTDESLAILESAAKQNEKLKFISESDNGIYDAMNKGIKRAKGKWVYFLGADDQLMPDVLKQVFSHPLDSYDMVYGDVCRQPSGVIYDGAFDLKKLFIRNISHQAIFYKRSLLQDLGLFKIQYKTRADYALNIQAFSQNKKTKYLPIVVAEFSDGGLSATYFDTDFWSDYRENYIQPFEQVIPRRERYGILWKYYQHLVERRSYGKAVEMFFLISSNEYKPVQSLRAMKLLGKSIAKKIIGRP